MFDEIDSGSTGNQPSIEDRIGAALGGGQPQGGVEDTLAGGGDEDTLQGGGDDSLAGGDDTLNAAGDDTLEGAAEDEVIDFEEAKGAKFKVPLKNGDEEVVEEMTLEELRLGYMRTKQFHAAREADAAAVRNTREEAGRYIGNVQQEYGKNLQQLGAFVDALAMGEFNGVDLRKLSQEDPARYVQAKARWDEIQAARGAIQQHLQHLENQREVDRKQRANQATEQFEPQLKADIPNWGPELKEKVATTAMKSYGFKAEELAAITDPRVARLLHDAYQFRALPDKKAIVDKKVTNVPKVLKPGAKPSSQVAVRDQQLRDRIRKSGGTDKRAIEERIALRLASRAR